MSTLVGFSFSFSEVFLLGGKDFFMGTHPPAYKKSGLIRSRLSLFCYVFLLVILFAFKGSNLNAHLADTSVLNVENGEVEVFVGDLVHIAVLRQEVKKTDDEAAKCIVVALGYDFTTSSLTSSM